MRVFYLDINLIALMVVVIVSMTKSAVAVPNVDKEAYRKRVVEMFYHAYDNYIHNAYPYDELKPITCQGFDTWGSYSLTLIDSLDMLILLGNRTEFERVVDLLGKNLKFDKDINVSVFETNIRVVGGLLSAHLLSYRLYLDSDSNELDVSGKLDPEWPCDGPLLKLAVMAANKLLPAFNTPTGMPYGTVNLKHGVPRGETTETCVAGVGTFLLEFGTLSRLTGDPVYENAAMRALDSLWHLRSSLDLIGNHVQVDTGKWTATDATIGSGVDSYFEYLVKAGIMLNKPELVERFRVHQKAINNYLYHEGWFFWSNMNKGQKTLPLFSSLEAFYPGLLVLSGDLEQALKLIDSYNLIWRQFGGLPEFFNIQTNKIHSNRDSYPLRPELIESLMYVLRATDRDEAYYQMAVDYLESIESITRLDCGFATVKDVKDHRLDNRMESFFLAETLKYLYLIFDENNFLHNDLSTNSFKVVKNTKGECIIETGLTFFNTEAHPIDGASVECCRAIREKEKRNFDIDLDLLTFIDPQSLFDRYIRASVASSQQQESQSKHGNVIHPPPPVFTKSMRDEYAEERRKREEAEQRAFAKMLLDCENNKASRFESSPQPLDDSFSCSLNNTFRIYSSLLNSQTYFP